VKAADNARSLRDLGISATLSRHPAVARPVLVPVLLPRQGPVDCRTVIADDAWRIAFNIARLPELLARVHEIKRDGYRLIVRRDADRSFVSSMKASSA
jgi:hypothetical protein